MFLWFRKWRESKCETQNVLISSYYVVVHWHTTSYSRLNLTVILLFVENYLGLLTLLTFNFTQGFLWNRFKSRLLHSKLWMYSYISVRWTTSIQFYAILFLLMLISKTYRRVHSNCNPHKLIHNTTQKFETPTNLKTRQCNSSILWHQMAFHSTWIKFGSKEEMEKDP